MSSRLQEARLLAEMRRIKALHRQCLRALDAYAAGHTVVSRCGEPGEKRRLAQILETVASIKKQLVECEHAMAVPESLRRARQFDVRRKQRHSNHVLALQNVELNRYYAELYELVWAVRCMEEEIRAGGCTNYMGPVDMSAFPPPRLAPH